MSAMSKEAPMSLEGVRDMNSEPDPILIAQKVTKLYGDRVGCRDVSFSLWPGEVLGIVGESGSGKSTLLRCLAGIDRPTGGEVMFRHEDKPISLFDIPEPTRRKLMRTEWGIVHQNPRDGLRMDVSAGGNVGERLMDRGDRHYGKIRAAAIDWLTRVEIGEDRIDDRPRQFSGGMQQRLQIARVLVPEPRLVFMDEPTGGLDVSVQARLLDLLRVLVRDLGIAAVIVTHDLAVARLLTDRLMVMKDGSVVEEGLTDQVLDDPQHAYTQLLTSAVLAA
jgi:putative phosphonate transport system ATP-binding protein